MGKPTTRTRGQIGSKINHDGHAKPSNSKSTTKAAMDEDTTIFIALSQELKEEGKKLFQKRDHEGALLKYEKALKLLPLNHIDAANLRTNMAACYMEMGMVEYPRAVSECNLALQIAPKYSKALLRRARCYEALNQLELAYKDVNSVLAMEPNNVVALEVAERLKQAIEPNGVRVEDEDIHLPPNHVEQARTCIPHKVVKDKGKKKKITKFDVKIVQEPEEKSIDGANEKKAQDKAVVAEKVSVKEEKPISKSVKLVHGEDIRWAQLPGNNCSMGLVRDIVLDRFTGLKGVLVKYKDQEGDLVTITTNDELKAAEGLANNQGFLKLYIAEVSPDKEPLYEGMGRQEKPHEGSSVEDWIIQFAKMFKNHVGFESDSYLELHEIGMKLYSEAMEEAVTSKDAQHLFDRAAARFQEMAALALFNWGNVHLSKARKRASIQEDVPAESKLAQAKAAYDWAQQEYTRAGSRYTESVTVKPDFYEGLVALGLQQFEQAKLSWSYVVGSKSELEIGPSAQVLDLYNKAEDSMEKGMQMWEEMEEQRLNGLSKNDKEREELRKFGLNELFRGTPVDQASELAASLSCQIYFLWGTILYERSVVEYKLSLPTWEECLEVAIEKFELAGASSTDIAVMIKNHCSNETALEGFKVDEIVHAWSEMYDADKWETGVASSPLEPLLRRRTPKLHSLLEHLTPS